MQSASLNDFYPRPPRGGRPVLELPLEPAVLISIHALREEGDVLDGGSDNAQDLISIHALREEGDRRFSLPPPARTISIHALREEGDFRPGSSPASVYGFLSTPSARRATMQCAWLPSGQRISIHALREEGDKSSSIKSTTAAYFYPRPPRGGRRCLRSSYG